MVLIVALSLLAGRLSAASHDLQQCESEAMALEVLQIILCHRQLTKNLCNAWCAASAKRPRCDRLDNNYLALCTKVTQQECG